MRTTTKHLLWRARNRVMGGKPVVIEAGGFAPILLHPAGQIAEAFWGGDFEPVERDFLLRAIRPGMNVVNIGANIGIYAILASRLAGPAGHVLAFEPSSQSCERLHRNLALNHCVNVTVEQIALGDSSGTILLRDDPGGGNRDALRFVERVAADGPAASAGERVRCTSLDAYRAGSRAPIDFMLVDVEGAELDVMRGARAAIDTSPDLVMLMECTDRIEDMAALTQEMGLHPFRWDMTSQSLVPCAVHPGNLVFRRAPEGAPPT
ncbi:MAG TPA: FkbM family methyltransferase [Stellaceae bacterium]|nr:FkbM family methyltransferase [Stellaceae bacterium]